MLLSFKSYLFQNWKVFCFCFILFCLFHTFSQVNFFLNMGKLPMKNDIFNSSSKLVVTIRENTLPIIGGNKKYLKKNLIFNVCHVSSFEYHWKPQQFIGQLMRSGNLISELLCMLWRSESHLAFAARSLAFILRVSVPLFTCAVCSDMWIWENTKGSLPSVPKVTKVPLMLLLVPLVGPR